MTCLRAHCGWNSGLIVWAFLCRVSALESELEEVNVDWWGAAGAGMRERVKSDDDARQAN